MHSTNPLTYPAFRQLYVAQVISLLGTGLSTIALGLLAWQLAGAQAGSVLGTALALKMVAYVTIAPVVGGFAHLIPRKQWLVGLDLLRAAVIVCLPWVTEVWQIYLLIFLISACSAGFTPIFQATIPSLFHSSKPNNNQAYTKALSLARLAYDLENLLTPTIAATLLVVLSFNQLFFINSFTMLISACLVAITLLPKPSFSERSAGIWRQVSYGISAYLRTPRLRALWALYFVVAAAGGMVIVNSVVYVKAQLGLEQEALTWVLMASGAGSMLVALRMPWLRDHFTERSILLSGGLLLALSLTMGSQLPELTGIMVLWFAIGMGSSMIQTPAGILVRRSCRESDAPALFSANFALSHGGWLLGYLLAGWVGSSMGLYTAFLITASVAWLALLLAWWLYPNPDPEDLWHSHELISHTHPHKHDDHHHHDHQHSQIASHEHHHQPLRHKHTFVIDQHHAQWPSNEASPESSSTKQKKDPP